MKIIWEEPKLVEDNKKSKNEMLLEALVGRPEQWGRLGTAKSKKAAAHRMYLLSADIKKLAERNGWGKFELKYGKLANNQGAIYGRYLGDVNILPEYAYRGETGIIST